MAPLGATGGHSSGTSAASSAHGALRCNGRTTPQDGGRRGGKRTVSTTQRPGADQWFRGWVRPCLLSRWGGLAAYAVVAVLGQVAAAGVPWLTGSAVNIAVGSDASMPLTRMALLLLALIAVSGCLGVLQVVIAETLSTAVARDTRDALFRGILRRGRGRSAFSPGDLTARQIGDSIEVGLLVSPGGDLLVEMVLGALVPLIFIALISPQLLLMPLIFCALFWWAMAAHTRRLSGVSAEERELNGALNSTVAETLGSMQTQILTGASVASVNRVLEMARAHRDTAARQHRSNARFMPALIFVVMLLLAAGHALVLLHRGDISPGAAVAFLGLFAAFRGALQTGSASTGFINAGRAAARRVWEVLVDLRDGARGERTGRAVAGDLLLEGATVRLGGRTVLDHVDLHVPAGAHLALLGSTGSGKSTLARLITGELLPDEGRVLIDGAPAGDLAADASVSRVAVVPQHTHLFSRTIGENIALGARGADPASIEAAARRARLDDLLDTLPAGLGTRVAEAGTTLSGGQRQRIGLARALITRPAVLVLDDWTSAVDPQTAESLRAVVRTRPRPTVIEITNRVADAIEADLVVVLHRGAVIAMGAPDDLRNSSAVYRRLLASTRASAADRSPKGAASWDF